jgi:hypothetical protein
MKTCPQPLNYEKKKSWDYYFKWLLRITILIGAIIAIFTGELFFGLLALLAMGIVVLPRYFTRDRLCFTPPEIEILILIVVFFELILADANSFYSKVPYYDKFMHALVPAIIGLMGMMIIYTFYAMGRLQASLGVMMFMIIMITMGMGAMLELVEFFYDQILYPYIGIWLPTGPTQGSMLAPPLQDTIEDLFTDLIGAILGALLGIWLIKRSEKAGEEPQLVDEIEEIIK